ncbi:MAG: hypothetical protein A3F84_27205 [Candidatus Handelsmanbacteria bacterium RIFCSPLOWO2_12_FULL_64_10]|uniref:Uroporphyrinogen decarboxylase (URO-D) domain-containing protein n=1 Tax=Handelsmanbacteria sp. (strain RIFCSPLOWO2_12_FULL_64_10) TaxID=1817868 RepID=A0A1F6CAX5_HANXR|nr:MAG: hypothetical protein A3F84_27205 [Candidatus Handelsmanbacteria bacterium RIFCSPLOWO2_12_FULL_64_10]
MSDLTGRERVLAVVRRSPVDRVPVGSMGFSEGVAREVRRLLGAPEDTDINALLGVDMRAVAPAYTGPDFAFKPEHARRSFFASSHKSYADGIVERPLRRASTTREVEAFPWPTADDYSFEEMAKRCAGGSDLALFGPGWTPTFSQLCELFGIETALINLIEKPGLIEAAIERITDLICGLVRGMCRATGGQIPIFKTSDDVATQRGLMFSPTLWRRFFKPGLARQLEVARGLGMLTMMHSCGDIGEILPELVDLGLDILEPTQAHLPGLNPERLRREFGGRLTFFGAISTQTVLPCGTPRDVRREVQERLRTLGEGGGYIVSPDHQVLDDVPAENVIALYQAAGSLSG